MHTIAIEDLATLFATEFVKQNKAFLAPVVKIRTTDFVYDGDREVVETPFLKMSFARRKKLIGKVLGSILDKGWQLLPKDAHYVRCIGSHAEKTS